MKMRFAVLGLILGVFLIFTFPISAQESQPRVLSERTIALAEIMSAIENDSFYQLNEKDLNAVQECIAGRAFTGFEVKKGETFKEDFKITSCFSQDKRAMYLTPAIARGLYEEREGHFGGIGISVETDKKIGGLKIREILEGSPVEKDGRLKVGDIISAAGEFVAGKETKMTSFQGLDPNKMTEIVKGAPGTKVALEVWRSGQKLPPIILTREDVKIKNIKSSEIEPGIGYLKISSFDKLTVAEDFLEAVMNFEYRGVKKLIIDLRRNPGGLMNATIGIASLFAPNTGNLIMEARWRGQAVGGGQKFSARSPGPFSGWKVAVLIDGGSASASEILAGSLRVWGAKIVGVKSYGKGSIQSAIPLSDGGEFRLTTGLYYLADGKTPEDGGIEPHFVIEDDPRTTDIDEALAVAIGILMD